MPNSSFDPLSGREGGWSSEDSAGLNEPDFGEVLVVGKSPINRVVVAKIVERSGLRHQAAAPHEAKQKLQLPRISLVILDGGADNRDCDALLSALVDARRVSADNSPSVILLSTRTSLPAGLVLGSPVDAVVAKPITTESLQPVVDRLLKRPA